MPHFDSPRKAVFKESNNHPGGRSGSKVPIKSGPAVGHGGKHTNATPGGGINRRTKGL